MKHRIFLAVSLLVAAGASGGAAKSPASLGFVPDEENATITVGERENIISKNILNETSVVHVPEQVRVPDETEEVPVETTQTTPTREGPLPEPQSNFGTSEGQPKTLIRARSFLVVTVMLLTITLLISMLEVFSLRSNAIGMREVGAASSSGALEKPWAIIKKVRECRLLAWLLRTMLRVIWT